MFEFLASDQLTDTELAELSARIAAIECNFRCGFSEGQGFNIDLLAMSQILSPSMFSAYVTLRRRERAEHARRKPQDVKQQGGS